MLKLAILLHKSIREIEQLDSREISEWLAFHQQFVLPDHWWSLGMVCSTIHRSMGGKAKPEDFFPKLAKPEPKDGASVFEKFRAMFQGFQK